MELSERFSVCGVWTLKHMHCTDCELSADNDSYERIARKIYWRSSYDWGYEDDDRFEDRFNALRFATVVVIWCDLNAGNVNIAKDRVQGFIILNQL
jgi:hypothetical protein